MSDDPLRQAEARVQRYWNVDGLHEIAVALIFGLTALWLWAEDLSPLPRSGKRAVALTFALLVCGGIWAEGALVKAIRQRLTYPRMGFVELRRPPRGRQVLLGGSAAVLAALLVIFVLRSHAEFERVWSVVVPGVAGGVFLWQIASQTGLSRFYALSAYMAVAGLAIAISGLPMPEGMILFWSVAAAGLMVSGGATLWRFLHERPPVEE